MGGGKGSATLSMAYAGAKFGNAVLCGLAGIETTECAYVMRHPDERAQLPYLASKVTFGAKGVKEAHPFGQLSSHEQERLRECIAQLKEEIDAGVSYASTTALSV